MKRPTNYPDSVFIEVRPGESEAEWVEGIRGVLRKVLGTPEPQWPRYEAGPAVWWTGWQFRSFRCVAGSVHAHLLVAAERGELDRGLLMLATRVSDNWLHGTVWVDGRKAEIDGEAIRSQLSDPAGPNLSPPASGLFAKLRSIVRARQLRP